MGRKALGNRMRSAGARLAFFVLFLGSSSDVFAYLDPSTGSMVVSAIVGIFASIALAVKTYWYKIKKFFRRPTKPVNQPGTKAATDPKPED